LSACRLAMRRLRLLLVAHLPGILPPPQFNRA
jgi:hypothetical protein